MASNIRKRKSPSSDIILRPVHPNAGIEADYTRQLVRAIKAMHKDVITQLSTVYASQSTIAQDGIADDLRTALHWITDGWFKKFDTMADLLGRYFATKVEQRSSAQLQKILRDGGMTVRFQSTPAISEIMEATVQQNVSLIKSIPQQYLSRVEQVVMQGVQNGGNLQYMTKELQAQFGVTKRRAAFIARDQSSKATTAFTRARQIEAGITEAIWMHSHAGKTPRPTHVKAGREKQRYIIAEGWYDPDPKVARYIWPGELINCRCTSKSVVKGFS